MSETNNTKQATWIALSGLFSFGFGIVSSMILSRYFNKADYGTYKQVIYVYGVMLTVFTLGLPKAYSYFLPRVDRNQAKSLINKLTLIFLALGAAFSIVLFFGAGIFADLLKNSELRDALRLFSLVPVFTLPPMGLEGILSTYRKTQFMAVYTIISRTFMLCCVALPVMLFGFGYKEAIIGFVISSAINCIVALFLKNYPLRDAGKEPCPVTIKEILQFSLPLLYASLWGMVILNCDQFFISRYYGTEVFAEFTNGSMELPFVGMLLGACSAILSPIFSRMSHEKVDPKTEVYPLWMSVFEKTAKLTYPIIIYCWFFADTIMMFLYGAKYEESYIYFRIKLFTYIFTLIVYAPLLINIGKVKYYARVHIWAALLVVAVEYLSVLTINSPYAISVISLLCQVGKTIALLWAVASYFEVRIDRLFPMRLIAKILLPSAIFLYLERLALLHLLPNMGSAFMLIVSFGIYAIVYYIYSLVIKMDYLSIIKPLLKKNAN